MANNKKNGNDNKGRKNSFLPLPDVYNTIFQNFKYLDKCLGNKEKNPLYNSILRNLKIKDEQDAIQSIKAYNVPYGIPPGFIERLLYYKGRGMLFNSEYDGKSYFLPFVGEGLNVYGFRKQSRPLPFNGSTEASEGKNKDDKEVKSEGKNKDDKEVKYLFGDRRWDIQYDIVLPDEVNEMAYYNKCVIINDYTAGISEEIVPRAKLVEPILELMATILCFLRTSLLIGSGIEGMKVGSSDYSPEVIAASNAAELAAINGVRWVPVVGDVQTEVLSHSVGHNIEEFLVALQSLDNIRLSFHGLENGGIFQKKAHELETEANMNNFTAGRVLADRVVCRQNAATIYNSFSLQGLWFEASEIEVGVDRNGNGELDNSDEPMTEEGDGENE